MNGASNFFLETQLPYDEQLGDTQTMLIPDSPAATQLDPDSQESQASDPQSASARSTAACLGSNKVTSSNQKDKSEEAVSSASKRPGPPLPATSPTKFRGVMNLKCGSVAVLCKHCVLGCAVSSCVFCISVLALRSVLLWASAHRSHP